MELDKSGLQERIFEVPSLTNERLYLFLWNMETNVSRWSQNAVEDFELPGEYIYDVAPIWMARVYPADLPGFKKVHDAIWEKGDKKQEFEYRIKNKDGKYVLCTSKVLVLSGEDGEPNLFTGTIINHDIQDNIDPITNLHGSSSFHMNLKRIVEKGSRAAVMKIAVNMFNQFNVLYGHEYGNEVLKELSDILRMFALNKGHLYRLDGAKFALIFPDMEDEAELRELYNKIKYAAEHTVTINHVAVPLTVSGSGMMLDHYKGTDIAIKSGLSYALGISKHERRGELVFYKEEGGEKNTTELQMLGDIHRSISKGCEGFYLCYQPLVDVNTEKIVGAEALVRWKKEPYGDVPPGRFISWLEVDPAFYELGNWIIKTALKEIKEVKKEFPGFILNVNVAASQLERKEFRGDVIRMVKEAGFPPEDFFMELTERCRNLDYGFLREEMKFFHENGLKLSLDDFGTGSSSLALLRELPIDELKIDMSFIRDIETNPINQSLVKNIVQTAKEMGLKTCLEGVESQGISRYLKHHNATYYQGYYYSRPVEIENFRDMLADGQEGK